MLRAARSECGAVDGVVGGIFAPGFYTGQWGTMLDFGDDGDSVVHTAEQARRHSTREKNESRHGKGENPGVAFYSRKRRELRSRNNGPLKLSGGGIESLLMELKHWMRTPTRERRNSRASVDEGGWHNGERGCGTVPGTGAQCS